jgi:hypothetical protein
LDRRDTDPAPPFSTTVNMPSRRSGKRNPLPTGRRESAYPNAFLITSSFMPVMATIFEGDE